jgi:glycosyltransferase involved in cell wall biosynthesis
MSPATRLWQCAASLRGADHILCLNEEDRNYIVRRFGREATNITRIFPAADNTYLRAYAKKTYLTDKRIIFFGTWLPRKGTTDLVPAFVALANRHPDVTLTVMGSGIPASSVLAEFPEHLHSRVECVAKASAEEYADRMVDAALYVIPSLFEGTPLTLMEAMATGLPPVATATCGMKDVITDGVNGLLVPIRDPLALCNAFDRLLTDRGLRERLGRQAHDDVAARYTWETVAKPVREVYERLANRN